MYIENLYIKAFGRLNDFELNLSPGVNIIEGVNESGKSTLAAFIKFMFYGFTSKERASQFGWDAPAATGTLTFSAGIKRYRIERVVRAAGTDSKPTYREAVQLVDLDTNMPCHKGESPGELFFGVDAEMFAATAFVSQLGGTTVSGNKVSEGIQNLLFSADESVNTNRALENLDAERVRLLHKSGKGGRIYELDTEIAAIETRLDAALKASDELAAKEAKLADYRNLEAHDRERAETLSEKLEVYEARRITESFENLRSLEKRSAELREKLQNSRGKEPDTLNSLRKAGLKLSQLSEQLKSIPDGTDEIPPSEKLIEYRAYGGREEVESERSDLESSAKTQKSVGILLAIFAVAAIVVAGLMKFLSIGRGSELAMILLVGGVVMAGMSAVLFAAASGSAKKKRELDERFDIPALEAELSERLAADEKARLNEAMRSGLTSQLDEVKETLWREFGVTPENIEARISELESAGDEFSGIRSEFDKVTSLESQLKGQLENYSEAEMKEKAARKLDVSDIDSSNFAAARREYEMLTKGAAQRERFAIGLEHEIAEIQTPESAARLETLLEERKSERERLGKELKALLLAYEKLNEASGELRESFAPRLAADAGELMSKLTDGKYREVGVGGELKMTCRTESGQREITQLSAGTQDAAYLALRIALCGLIYRKEEPPMICDESFSRMDDRRTAVMLGLLASRTQSLVLTANGREAKLAGIHNYIKL